MSNIDRLISDWQNTAISSNLVFTHKLPPEKANWVDFPHEIHPWLLSSLQSIGISSLYSHQKLAWDNINAGLNVVIATGTASGKTLCYTMPIFNDLLNNNHITALHLFPTKALTGDQKSKINQINSMVLALSHKSMPDICPAIYDGDTPQRDRLSIRNKANLILTNPDMLHIGILPHHTLWERILSHLKYIVIDEIHIYRGVFGSHLANVLRRLKRLTNFYGSKPQYIMTSATIANPVELAEKLVEERVELIDQDGSPYGERRFIFYNPPIINQELSLRSGIVNEGVKLAGDLLSHQVQSIFFARSRKTVEITLKYLQNAYQNDTELMKGYRSGYLPTERRFIENGLRNGNLRTVVSTNALELGIDMGSVDAVVLMGYPGSISAFRQQSGRAGRKQEASLSLLLASSTPLDQFIVNHPDFVIGANPENALINPNNPLILLAHLKCAAFELPFSKGDSFGALKWEEINSYLDFLLLSREVINRNDRFLWMADAYPANQISLRSASATPVLLQYEEQNKKRTIGEVDFESSIWMVHPGAIYLHQGDTYLVHHLDLENHYAELSMINADYYTEPKKNIEIQKIKEIQHEEFSNYQKYLGEILVSTSVVGFQKIRLFTQEVLGIEPLDLPPTELRTIAYWLVLSPKIVDTLRSENLWKNDPIDYGSGWRDIRRIVRERDHFTCQLCGHHEQEMEFHVHHKAPFRTFQDHKMANQLDNLITLCPICHQRVETNIRMRSGLSGLCYLMAHLAPLILMCDSQDLGAYSDPQAKMAEMQPAVVLFDQFPGGIGLSESLYRQESILLKNSFEHVSTCACQEGCPSCVGPAGENGIGGKKETEAILAKLLEGHK